VGLHYPIVQGIRGKGKRRKEKTEQRKEDGDQKLKGRRAEDRGRVSGISFP
jgi:hypothetical protein